jgi:hypothetical protein
MSRNSRVSIIGSTVRRFHNVILLPYLSDQLVCLCLSQCSGVTSCTPMEETAYVCPHCKKEFAFREWLAHQRTCDQIVVPLHDPLVTAPIDELSSSSAILHSSDDASSSVSADPDRTPSPPKKKVTSSSSSSPTFRGKKPPMNQPALLIDIGSDDEKNGVHSSSAGDLSVEKTPKGRRSKSKSKSKSKEATPVMIPRDLVCIYCQRQCASESTYKTHMGRRADNVLSGTTYDFGNGRREYCTNKGMGVVKYILHVSIFHIIPLIFV